MRPLDVRSELFGARTAMFYNAGEDRKRPVHMIKMSWVAPRLTSHELVTLRNIRKAFGESLESELPLLPQPIGLAKQPSGFQGTTSDTTQTSSAAANFPARHLCALVTRQHRGDHIGRQVLPRYLVRIHQQLAEVLLKLAEKGYHYRDLNDGNVRLLRGSKSKLYLADYGNVRKHFSIREERNPSDAAATIDRAKDDTRSATPLFAPSCYAIAKAASEEWGLAVASVVERAEQLSRRVSKAAGGRVTSGSLRASVDAILENLEDLHEALRDSNVHSHRYIDDMESALYLHLWTMALNRGLSKFGQIELSRKLRDDKTAIWTKGCRWELLLDEHCKPAGRRWKILMGKLRKVVYEARQALTAELLKPFEADGRASIETLRADLEKWRFKEKENDMAVADATVMIIDSLWQGKGILDDKSGLQDIERECYNECIRLLYKVGHSGHSKGEKNDKG
ncbi:hypothetical protein BCV69DRAFT_127844 [Microstroma glucosiphilum]|uniref:Protein kinase domain-containing protein n=1 Tax=Pseudomicrostroma glucosiphilum TaxID=1684307 RepID=A0A316TZI0_9BASI|nr:hypothetical protein BCV69DRAFT_127844 [Pseudomicrostroma glucosiphilum]PWN17731.1 hypothetical protein BCV69DRAFT_127844 [Pseudomicrostroma glucosiphilum]